MSRLAQISVWILLALVLVGSFGFAQYEHHQTKYNKLTINIEAIDDHYFISEAEIVKIINENIDTARTTPIAGINTKVLEKLINNNPFVDKADVFSLIDGVLCVSIKQRRPIIRVFSAISGSYYIDDKGVFMPLSDDYTARLPIATGDIYESYAYRKARIVDNKQYDVDTVMYPKAEKIRYTLKDTLYTLANYIDTNKFWKAQIQQIYINKNHDIELIPTVGNHRVVLGKMDDLDDKMQRLFTFYKEGLNLVGWDKYRTLNLQFKNQIICSKK